MSRLTTKLILDTFLHFQHIFYSFPSANINQNFDFVDREFECSTPVTYTECTIENKAKHQLTCNEINSSPFISCNLNRTELIEACVFDLCIGMNEDQTICDMFESYVSKCNGNGITENFIENWRGDRCARGCGENQVYNSCGKSACQATTNYCSVDFETCDQSEECNEGCYCEAEYLLNEDGECVTLDQCTEEVEIDRLVFESTLCYTCVEQTVSLYKDMWSAYPVDDLQCVQMYRVLVGV